MQDDLEECFLCGNRSGKLDRHEVFSGPNRSKSKALGCWCMLCHDTCHQGFDGVHNNANRGYMLKRKAQRIAMNHYGWSTDEFIRRFGKNYI